MEISAARLRKVRNHMDLTQSEMAKFLDVSPRTVFNWEANGVPESKVNRIGKLLEESFHEFDIIESFNDAPVPELSEAQSAAIREQLEFDRANEKAYRARTGPSSTDRLMKILEPMSDTDLLLELQRRASARGDRSSNWNAVRFESYQQFISPQWEDPDYSNMSDEDVRKNRYGLAAKEADQNIGFDDLPHEP